MKAKTLSYIDKSKWLKGPWSGEPDLVFYEDPGTKLPCLIERHDSFGCLNGYVGVREGHPAYQVDYEKIITHLDLDYRLVPAIVYSGFRQEPLKLLDKRAGTQAETQKIWWLGFDNFHKGDVNPIDGTLAILSGLRLIPGFYKNIDYLKKQIAHLASELQRHFLHPRKRT